MQTELEENITFIYYLSYLLYVCRKLQDMENENKQERSVIHLEMDGNHHYFGSIANIYEYFDKDVIGISYGSLRNYGLSVDNPYQNKKCIIRKGVLLAKPSNRGRK